MRLAKYNNFVTPLSALLLCSGCGIRSGLFVGDAGVDSAADEGEAGSGGSSEGAAGTESLCGNGLIDEGEQCDGQNLGGETCRSLGEGDGELKCGPACLFDVSMCAPRYPTTPNPGPYGTEPPAPVAPSGVQLPFDGGVGDASGMFYDFINSLLDNGMSTGGRTGENPFGGNDQ